MPVSSAQQAIRSIYLCAQTAKAKDSRSRGALTLSKRYHSPALVMLHSPAAAPRCTLRSQHRRCWR